MLKIFKSGMISTTTFFRKYIPKQNGISHRVNLTLIKPALALLTQGDLSSRSWTYGLRRVAYVLNLVTHLTTNLTLYEIVTGQISILKNIPMCEVPTYRLRLPRGSKALVSCTWSFLAGDSWIFDIKKRFMGRDCTPRLTDLLQVTFDEPKFPAAAVWSIHWIGRVKRLVRITAIWMGNIDKSSIKTRLRFWRQKITICAWLDVDGHDAFGDVAANGVDSVQASVK